MEEYSLDRHLKSYCDAHEEYQNLYATWSLNRKSCSEMLKTVLLRYPHYSLHDASHAEAILSKIEMLLGSRVSQLSPTDTWLVLHAAYAHDLGMVVQWRDLQKAWSDLAFQNYLTSLAEGEDKDLRNAVQWLRKMEAGKKDDALWPLHIVRSVQLIDAAYFRSQHAAMSKSYIERIAQGLQIDLGHSGLVRSRLLQLLGEICACHTAPEDQVLELPYETNGFGSDYAHPRFVAMLLRLGDLLDVDNGRFNAAAEEVIGGLPESSVAHKEKHEATKHLLITPEQIEFASDGPDEPSYLEARRFVNWLEAEIRFLTMNWVILVPKGFGGFAPRFEKPKLCIKGVPDAEGLAGLHFEISQKKAFEIIEGSNIYENKLVFIRELLQNAMDASKIQLWRDLCAGTYQAWIGEKDSKKLQALQPYSLQAEIYHSYPIKIHLSTDEDQVTQIEIEDRGTGITLDTFKRMCNVGASPSGSDELKKEIACLPRQKAEIKTDHLKTLTETVFVLQYVNDSFKIQQVRLGSILPFDDNLFFVHGSMFKTVDGLDYDRIDDVCKKLTAAAEKAPDLQKIILPLDERLIRAASNCHKAFIRRANGLFLYQISLFPVGLQVDAETRELLLKSLGERTLISRTIFDDEEHSPRRRAISGLADYPNLCVSRLPVGVMYSSFSHCNAIISPFNCDQKRLAESESCDLFVAQILESSAFQRVVQWTMDHAPDNAALRSVETVKQEYQKLMQDYYQVIHSAEKTQTHLNSTTSPAVES